MFDFKGRAGKYSDFVWNSGCFDGVDWDERHRKNAIYLIKGHSWQQEVDESENGNYDYLMGADIDFDRPYVVEELTRWGEWYMKTTGVDGSETRRGEAYKSRILQELAAEDEKHYRRRRVCCR